MPGHPRNWLCQAAGCAPLAQQRGVGAARSAETGGCFISVAPGRPKPLTHPLGGQRTARSGGAWGLFHAFHSRKTVAKGGRVSTTEWVRPWLGTGSVPATPQGVPALLPP